MMLIRFACPVMPHEVAAEPYSGTQKQTSSNRSHSPNHPDHRSNLSRTNIRPLLNLNDRRGRIFDGLRLGCGSCRRIDVSTGQVVTGTIGFGAGSRARLQARLFSLVAPICPDARPLHAPRHVGVRLVGAGLSDGEAFAVAGHRLGRVRDDDSRWRRRAPQYRVGASGEKKQKDSCGSHRINHTTLTSGVELNAVQVANTETH